MISTVLGTIRNRMIVLLSLLGLAIIGGALFAVSRLSYVDQNFTEYHTAAVASETRILMISRDMNYVSRLTRSIMLGDNFEKNTKSIDEYIDKINESFSLIKKAGSNIHDKEKAKVLDEAVNIAQRDAQAFLEDGRSRMQALGKVERTPEVLHQAWEGYHKAATPLANTARDSFKKLSTMVQEMMDSNHAATGNAISSSSTVLIITVCVVLLIALAGSIWLIRSITHPIDVFQKTIEQVERNSDLRKRIELNTQDELGVTATAINKMLQRFQEIISQVMHATVEVGQATGTVRAITSQTTDNVNQQQMEIEQVATAMNEMSATVQEVARNAMSAADAATTADAETKEGSQVVNATITSIDELAKEVERATTVINKLGEDSETIGKVLDVIRGIAEQTNLLALNAAIEAARAGDQGRGFAVVADEVRTLASRTQNSTKEIQEMIGRLQNGAREAVAVMEVGRTQAHNSVERARAAGNSLQKISHSVATISEMNTQIANAAAEQSSVAEDINHKVVKIKGIAEQSVIAINNVASAGDQLNKSADDLHLMVKQFHV